MALHRRLRLGTLFALFITLSLFVNVASAQEIARLHITDVDTSNFPAVSVTFFAQGNDGSYIGDVSGVTVTEDGVPVTASATSTRDIGVDLVFVINANTSLDQDDGDGATRRDKVRDAINRYADNFMNQNQLDHVWIIVPPEDDSDGVLLSNAIFVNEVKNAINFYDPDLSDEVPLNDMLNQAIDILSTSGSAANFQAIVLFTDGAEEGDLLDYDGLIERATREEISFYPAILGARADDNEIENMAQLYEPTNGNYVHMPEVVAIDELYLPVSSFSTQQVVTYSSQLNESGTYTLGLDLNGAANEAPFSVDIGTPTVTILLDNSQPIIRVADSAEMALNEMQPDMQTVVGQVTWAGTAREISSVALFVDGAEVLIDNDPNVNADGVVELIWDISELDEDSYNLSLVIVDELGVRAESSILPLSIEVQRPQPAGSTETDTETEPATAGTDGEAAPTEGEEATSTGFVQENLTLLIIAGSVLLILGGLFFLLLLVGLMRRRRAAPEPEPTPAVVPAAQTAAATPFDAESTQIMMPAFAQTGAEASLQPLENAPEYSGPIYITDANVAMGRDAKLSQVVFKDKSVSRLHARIMQTNGEFRLYDEGSASGTYHNYERVGLTPKLLSDNDDIHLGRVHLRFKVQGSAGGDNDATQIFGPGSAPVAPGGEDMNTQPYIPQGPGGPPAGGPSSHDDDDPDDLSTQPYVPHSPR